MTALPAYGLMLLVLSAAPSVAEPCVAGSFDLPMPGATNVQVKYADVPSAFFPSVWQEGDILGFSYRIFSNGDGEVTGGAEDGDWKIDFRCDLEAEACDYLPSGDVPIKARSGSELIGRCLLGEQVSADDFMILDRAVPEDADQSVTEFRPERAVPPQQGPALFQEPEEFPEAEESPPVKSSDPVLSGDVTGDVNAEIPAPLQDATPDLPVSPSLPVATPCGLATIEQGTAIETLQRLLIAAGARPGVVDGVMGRRTRRAIARILGAEARDLPVDNLLAQLDSFLCKDVLSNLETDK